MLINYLLLLRQLMYHRYIVFGNRFSLSSGTENGCLVHDVGKICSRHTETSLSNLVKIDAAIQFFVFRMNSDDSLSTL